MSMLWKVQQYLARTGMAPTTFGRRAVNDPRLVLDMRRGRMPKPHTVARIAAFIAEEQGQ